MEKKDARNEKMKKPHAETILTYLRKEGYKTQKELIKELNIPYRSVRYTVRKLRQQGLLKNIPNLGNLRSPYVAVVE